MKNKGFTLIELLAVIVILAIIALIATPIILGIINDAKEESNERSVELYASAVKNGIAAYQLKEGKEVLTGTYTEETLPFEVSYDGDVKCKIIQLYEEGNVYLEGCTVNKGEKEYSLGRKEEDIPSNNNTSKPCALDDKDEDGVASLSDIVTCGTESFYVMTNENNEIIMLAMYNLDVGNIKDDSIGILEPIENPTNKQSELAKGWIEGSSILYGIVAFSSDIYWDPNGERDDYPTWIYDENIDIIHSYLSEYGRILKEELNVSSAKTTLISKEQLEELGCNGDKETCGPSLGQGKLENPAPEWVYSTCYWTGTAASVETLWFVESSGYFYGGMEFSNVYGGLGVRPVVTISISEI